jgi:hypothetical protein
VQMSSSQHPFSGHVPDSGCLPTMSVEWTPSLCPSLGASPDSRGFTHHTLEPWEALTTCRSGTPATAGQDKALWGASRMAAEEVLLLRLTWHSWKPLTLATFKQ